MAAVAMAAYVFVMVVVSCPYLKLRWGSGDDDGDDGEYICDGGGADGDGGGADGVFICDGNELVASICSGGDGVD